VFTDKEMEYLTGQRLGRLATVTMLIRITPERITSWGIDASGFGPPNSRKVGTPL
jgi:hypothetical protein